MPYIKSEERTELDPLVDKLAEHIETEGMLNYAITRILLRLWKGDSRLASRWRAPFGYGKLNTLMGVLECVKAEFYRAQGGPYELRKLNENGPVRFHDSP